MQRTVLVAVTEAAHGHGHESEVVVQRAGTMASGTPFAFQTWRSEEDRFFLERKKFDFDSLSFGGLSGASERFTATDAGSSNPSQDFSSQLDIEHSQRLVQRSSAAGLAGSGRKLASSYHSLFDFNLDQLAIRNVCMVGRDAEFESLLEFYENRKIKMATIIGKSGSGKSVLAREIRGKVVAEKGIFCGGKFDLQNRGNPYQAIAEAINGFIRQVSKDRTLLAHIRQAIQEALGEDGSILTELVPSYKKLETRKEGKSVDDDEEDTQSQQTSSANPTSDRGITERALRIQNVFVSFIRAVSSAEHPLIIFLDDIQWAGPASMALIDVLMNEPSLEHFFLVTTCRSEYLQSVRSADSENDKKNPLLNLLEKHKSRIGTIELEGLGTDAVQQVVNALLRMDDSTKTTHLAEIVYKKTAGNPYFVLEFMRALVDEELVHFDTAKMDWSWFEHEIASKNVAENVAEAVAKRLKKLDQEDLFVIQIGSCLSRSFDQATIEYLLVSLQMVFESEWSDMSWPHDLGTSLANLVEKGILESSEIKNTFAFAHDQLQQAAFSLISEERRIPLQFEIGKRLIEGMDEFHRDEFLFTAVELCGMGAYQMDANERSAFAFWAFLAGDISLEQGAFQSALKFMEQAANCIGSLPFQKDAELALPLFSGAAEAAYCVSELDKADKFARIVLAESDISVHKKIRVALVEMKVKCAKREFLDAATFFRKTVKDLGGGVLSKSPGTLATLFHITQTIGILKKYDQKKLIELPECTNPNMAAALSAHATISSSLYVANPNLFVIAACKATQWSLKFGVTKSTPISFCCFASLLIALNDTAKALELAESSLALCEMYNYKEPLPFAVAIVFGFVRHWSRPMQQFVSPMRYGIDVGTKVGCMDHVAVATNIFGLLEILTCSPTLPEAITEIQSFRQKMIDNNNDDQLSFTECNLRFALKLAYPHREESSVTDGNLMSESDMRNQAKKNDDVVLDAFIDYFKMQIFVYFDEPLEGAKAGSKVVDFGFKYGQGTPLVPRCSFMIGLANVLSYKKNGRSMHLRVARSMMHRQKKWAKAGNPNVIHFLKLLEAELFSVAKKKEKAQASYNEAITTSKRMGYSLDFALSNELCALFQRDVLNNTDTACYHMQQAVEAYEGYGALNKALHVKRTYPGLITVVRE